MKQELINSVLSQMMPYLNNDQAARLQETLEHALFHMTIIQEEAPPENSALPLDAFLAAKKVEGCSEKTLAYYRKTVQDMLDGIGKTAQQVRKLMADLERDGVALIGKGRGSKYVLK